MEGIDDQSRVTTKATFRKYLPDLNSPRFIKARDQDAYQYVEHFRETKHPAALFKLTEAWGSLLDEPFHGMNVDGEIKQGLFELQGQGTYGARACKAATNVLNKVSPAERSKLQYPLHAREWRCWSNLEFLLRPLGVRLEEVSEELALLVLGAIEATLSHEGYQRALAAMRINHFLGDLVELPK